MRRLTRASPGAAAARAVPPALGLVLAAALLSGCGTDGVRKEGPADAVSESPVASGGGSGGTSSPSTVPASQRVDPVALVRADPKVDPALKAKLRPCPTKQKDGQRPTAAPTGAGTDDGRGSGGTGGYGARSHDGARASGVPTGPDVRSPDRTRDGGGTHRTDTSNVSDVSPSTGSSARSGGASDDEGAGGGKGGGSTTAARTRAGGGYPVDVSYGRLTGGSAADVVVNVLTCADGTGVGSYVYHKVAGRYRDVFTDEQPPVYADVVGSTLRVTTLVYAPGDAVCCPSGEFVVTYRWSAVRGKFVQVSRVRTGYNGATEPSARGAGH